MYAHLCAADFQVVCSCLIFKKPINHAAGHWTASLENHRAISSNLPNLCGIISSQNDKCLFK